MASYPGPKVHRVSRRKLGKGQHPQPVPASITATVETTTVHLAFDRPVIISGAIPYVTSTGVVDSQTIVDNQHVDLVCSTSQEDATWSIAGNCGAIATFQGGGNAPAGGTF